jgi:hypothetical protein
MAGIGRSEGWRIASELLEVARADTVYTDLYLLRARELLAPELSEAQWSALSRTEDELASGTDRIATAMSAGDWQQVRELTARVADLKRAAAERAPVRGAAAGVYGFDEILVDPFSPGLAAVAGVPERELPALRDAAVKRLERLRAADPQGAALYDARRAALAALPLSEAGAAGDAAATGGVGALRARAKQALADGDLAQLDRLSAQIVEAERASGEAGPARAGAAAAAADLARPFGADVAGRAAKLGLAAHRIDSTAEQVQARFRPEWRPALARDGGGTTVRLQVEVPHDVPEPLRDTLELMMSRPFVTSAGTRYMPTFVAEDVLVEDFDEPPPGTDAPSPLLEALGFRGRRGLARRWIEKAIRERGPGIVVQLGLEPREHRLACVPPDLFTRLGAKLGWGKREHWTHLDGYMASKERKLTALAGGDVRFGGLQDLVAVGADYDSDRLVARFAVVQRRRFATW